jgi:hypothetical protein
LKTKDGRPRRTGGIQEDREVHEDKEIQEDREVYVGWKESP